jgi:DNA-binding MarR family transcriptional regulator
MDINVLPSRARRRPPAPGAASDADAIVEGLRRIVKALHDYSRDVQARFDLTAPQLWALKTLARRPDLSIGALADELAVHQSSISVLVDRLEDRGLVQRHRAAPDRRVVRLRLTARGRAAAAAAPEPAQGRLLHALRAMPAGRVTRLRRAVEELVRAMHAEDVEPTFFFADR